jgi:hypothetical protein
MLDFLIALVSRLWQPFGSSQSNPGFAARRQNRPGRGRIADAVRRILLGQTGRLVRVPVRSARQTCRGADAARRPDSPGPHGSGGWQTGPPGA